METQWQKVQVTDQWKSKEGFDVEVSHFDGNISSLYIAADTPDDYEFPNADTTEQLKEHGWTFVGYLKSKTVELLPFVNIFDVTKEIITLAPEQLAGKEIYIRGLIKRLGHVEKHSVYSRFKTYFGKEISPGGEKFLDLKIETHRDYSRKDPDTLGKGE